MNVLVLGVRRQGKSTFALSMALAMARDIIIWDPNDQYPIVECISIDQLSSHLCGEMLPNGWRLIRVGPDGSKHGGFDTHDLTLTFTRFGEIIFNRRNYAAIIDESHMLQGSLRTHPLLDRLNRRSKPDQVIIQTSHRWSDVSTHTRFHSSIICFFFNANNSDLQKMRAEFGDEIPAILPDLKLHEVLVRELAQGGIENLERWDDPEEWYIDLENENT